MIKFDFLSVADHNGFIRLENVDKFSKFVDMFDRMSPYSGLDPNDALYKDYSVTVHTSKGTYNFAEVCQADMFIRRIAKYLPLGWVMWASDNNAEKLRRTNSVFYIWKYSYCNMHKAHSQSLVINYYDGYGNGGKITVNVHDLHTIVVKKLVDCEVEQYLDFVKFMQQKPEPIYKLMIMKQEYKDNYKLYVDDCKKYDFKPLPKVLIDQINIEFEGVPTTFTPDGGLGWNPDDDDVEVVNKDLIKSRNI